MIQSLPERIFLVGMPASGKSAVGKIFAEKLAYTFIDLDKRIEAREQKTIAEIFRSNGEHYFRELEREILHHTFLDKQVVVSCGGGTPCFFDNIQQMKQQGTVVYMQTEVETLVWRLKHGFGARPLFTDDSHEALYTQLSELLAKRRQFYSQAHHIIAADAEPPQVGAELLQLFS